MSEQLALGIGPEKSLRFDNFYTIAGNRLLVNQLKLQAEGEGEQWVLVHGTAESGRSHLLQASCHQAASRNLTASYIPLREFLDANAEAVLEGAEQVDLVCLDDLDAVIGMAHWEEALFHLYNRALHSGTALLAASRLPAGSLPCGLPDLHSRLKSFSVYQLTALSEEQRLEALIFRAIGLGMELEQEVADYLYHRAARNLTALFDILDRLDRESLRHQRSLTKPFVRSVLKW